MRIDDDEFYTVTFEGKQPLGVVFERSGDWAIIKSSTNTHETGILVGSVLSKINARSYILDNYQNAIDRLKGWEPPLSLTFRKAPSKNGFLLKESRSRSNPQKKVGGNATVINTLMHSLNTPTKTYTLATHTNTQHTHTLSDPFLHINPITPTTIHS